MTVKELIELLGKVDQEAELEIKAGAEYFSLAAVVEKHEKIVYASGSIEEISSIAIECN